jgi:protein involved in polysaccharide export with SLBB domain
MPQARQPSPSADYVVGSQDMLTITSYDQGDLSGKFTVEADGTFTYPLIGRVKAGGMTLRQVEAQLKKQLKDEGFFNNPQITVSMDQYRSQKIFVVGEVRTPGSYPLSGDMNLVEALARAGSTLPAVTVRRRYCPIRRTSTTPSVSISGTCRTARSRRTPRCGTATQSSCRAPRACTYSAR